MNILEVISCFGSKPKDEFQEIIRHFYPTVSGYERNCIQRDLEALGHIHTDHVRGKVHVMAPRMCVLPTLENGISSAVLTGVRPSERIFLDELRHLPAVGDDKLKVEETGMDEGFPSKIILSGLSQTFFHNLQRVTEHTLFIKESERLVESGQLLPNWHLLGDPAGTPGAWFALHTGIDSASTETLHDRLYRYFYREDRQPRNNQSLENADSCEVFDPNTNKWAFWGSIRNTYDRNLLLIKKDRYKYLLAKRTGNGWILYIEKFNHDPLWAKWAVLQARNGGDPLLPKIEGSDFLIPHGLPLPIQLHRVCCLCSGTLPVLESDRGVIRYTDVPFSIQSQVIRKLSLRQPQNP